MTAECSRIHNPQLGFQSSVTTTSSTHPMAFSHEVHMTPSVISSRPILLRIIWSTFLFNDLFENRTGAARLKKSPPVILSTSNISVPSFNEKPIRGLNSILAKERIQNRKAFRSQELARLWLLHVSSGPYKKKMSRAIELSNIPMWRMIYSWKSKQYICSSSQPADSLLLSRDGPHASWNTLLIISSVLCANPDVWHGAGAR